MEVGAKPGRALVYAGRIGYAAHGIVYAVLGILALLTAFGEAGGKLTDSRGALQTIGEQPFGAALLWVTGLGLFCYALWSAVRAALDPEHKGSDGKGTLKRVGYGVTCVVHLGLALYAVQLAYGSSSGGRGGTRTWVGKVLELPFGAALIGLVGLIAIGFGLQQIYIAVKGKVGHQYASAPLSETVMRVSRRVARVGVFARGLVFPVIGASLVFAALGHDAGEAQGFGEALGEFAQAPFGEFMLTFVAAGLFAYGLHLLFIARYGRLAQPR